MKIYPLIKTVLTHPYYVASYYRKLIHAFDFFNIDYHLFGGYSFPPKSICFILTEKCNLQCKMCDIGRRNVPASNEIYSPLVQSIRSGNEDMSTGEWLTLIEDLSGFYPHPLVLLTGTEPLAPGDSLVFYYETTIEGDLIPNEACTTGNPVDDQGDDIPGLTDPEDCDTANVVAREVSECAQGCTPG